MAFFGNGIRLKTKRQDIEMEPKRAEAIERILNLAHELKADFPHAGSVLGALATAMAEGEEPILSRIAADYCLEKLKQRGNLRPDATLDNISRHEIIKAREKAMRQEADNTEGKFVNIESDPTVH